MLFPNPVSELHKVNMSSGLPRGIRKQAKSASGKMIQLKEQPVADSKRLPSSVLLIEKVSRILFVFEIQIYSQHSA